MQKLLFSLILFIFTFDLTGVSAGSAETKRTLTDSIIKIEMSLSAFGVEADDFPSIEVYIDFINDSNKCVKSYYNPAFKGSEYKLSDFEIIKILALLKNTDWEKLKNEYKVEVSDQPTSTITIYTSTRKFTIKDYGLEGEYPLQELYNIAYKF